MYDTEAGRVLARSVRNPETNCWTCNYVAVDEHGRPFLKISASKHGRIRACEAVYISAGGRIGKSEALLQRCGNAACVNPAHQYVAPRVKGGNTSKTYSADDVARMMREMETQQTPLAFQSRVKDEPV